MLSDRIYSRDSKGKIRFWQYELEDGKWRTIAGLLDGKPVVSEWTVCTPKSQPTPEAQAHFEANAEKTKKLERDYRATIDEVDVKRASVVKPMLAQEYESFSGPCHSQPKLDGMRCIATKDGLWSRQGKPIVSCPHIMEALKPYFDRNPSLILDGELYNHSLRDDFNEIMSLVRTSKNLSEEHLEKTRKIVQYHIYDTPSYEDTFGARYAWLLDQVRAGGPLVYVPTDFCKTKEQLDEIYSFYLEWEYEGQMVRLPSKGYEQKRSKSLLKRKEFKDEEFPFVRFTEGEGNWSGCAKSVTCLLPDGREFSAGVKGTQDFARDLLGKTFVEVTVTFQRLTPDGVPRFPIAKAFWETKRDT